MTENLDTCPNCGTEFTDNYIQSDEKALQELAKDTNKKQARKEITACFYILFNIS